MDFFCIENWNGNVMFFPLFSLETLMVISHFNYDMKMFKKSQKKIILFQPHLDIQLYNYEVSLREASLKYSEEEKLHQGKSSYDFF